jgi:putative drug exporter of the RND superfamily
VFSRLARWCYDHRWRVVAAWIGAIVVGYSILGAAGGAQTNADFRLPGAEATKGADILEESFGGQGAGFGGTVVFYDENGVDDPEVKSSMEDLFAKIAKVDGVHRVGSPYDQGGERQIANQGKFEGKIAFAQIDIDPEVDEAELNTAATDIRTIHDKFVDDNKVDGLQVELGGQTLSKFDPPKSELLGLAFAIIILILAFGSVLAMGLPIGMAISGIAAGSMLAGFFSFIVHPPSFASTFGLMIGLGVGIDYALFIVTRYRENLHKGQDVRQAVVTAIDTAGRAVIFAGATVVISIMGMLVMRLAFIDAMAVAIATVVASTMVASVTLLPALLSFVQHRVELTRWGGLLTAGFVAIALVGMGLGVPLIILVGMVPAVLLIIAMTISFFAERSRNKDLSPYQEGQAPAAQPFILRREVVRKHNTDIRQTLAYRWSRVIQHRPWAVAIASTVVLVLLAIPLFSLRLANSDEGNFPEDTTTRKAYDLLTDGFGAGYNGQGMLVAALPDGGVDDSVLDDITEQVRNTEGVASVGDPFVSEDGKAVAWEVFPDSKPQDKETSHLVTRLRNTLPDGTGDGQLNVLVTGSIGFNVDFTDRLVERLPYFIGAVLLLSFLLLMAVFRSVLVPLKAVIMNLLSIGAAYGVMVAGFQWGWLGGILDFEAAPIEPWMPMMLFAIVFGLSMDYEVFLLSRVREEWQRTGDSRTSVADGLAVTARVITAAALIMVFVFGAFLLEDLTVVKLMGVGLATAVLLDATIVRMLLVPATMELLGDKNWWIPKWLDRILPNIDVEGGHDEPETELELEPVGPLG